MATDRARFSVSLDPELYARVEDYRFENRYSQMSRAVEALIKRGLDSYNREQNSILNQAPAMNISPAAAFGASTGKMKKRKRHGKYVLRKGKKVQLYSDR